MVKDDVGERSMCYFTLRLDIFYKNYTQFMWPRYKDAIVNVRYKLIQNSQYKAYDLEEKNA